VSRQQQAKEHLERSQLADAADDQNDAAEHIQQAIDAIKDKQDQSQDQQSEDPQDQETEQPPQQDQEQPQQEDQSQQQQDPGDQQAQAAEATADEIMDKEEENREKRRVLIQGQQKVERDW
jgi:hypothetical protein